MIKLLLASLFIVLSLQADHMRWLGSYDKALEKAHDELKPLIVFLVKKECATCHDILRDTFMNQAYIKQLNETFIPVIVTYEGRESYPIEMYYSTTFPTLFFVNSFNESFLTKPLLGKDITHKAIQKFLDA